MKIEIQKKARSNIDRLRLRLEVLEKCLINFIELFNPVCYKNNYGQLLYAYLSWTKQQLRIFEKDKVDINSYYFIKHLNSFELKIRYALNEMNKQELRKGKKIVKLYTLNQPQFRYGTFLQHGIKVFFGVIDIYGIWLKPQDILSILTTDELLSFVFIAILARYTTNRNDPGYKYVYRNTLRNIINKIPKMLENNNLNNVIALGLLTYLMMSHFKIDLANRYFYMATRMAGTLGLGQDKIDKDRRIDEKEKSLKYALSLTYLVLSSIMPEIPCTDFMSNEFFINLPPREEQITVYEPQFDLSRLKIEMFFSTDIGTQLTSIFVKINSYAQRVKANFSLHNIEKVTNEELRLPSDEFNQVITELVSLNQSRIIEDNMGYIEYNSICFKIMCQMQLMYLYYPIILIYPKPVKFNQSEIVLLFQAANQFFIEYKNLLQYCSEESKDKDIDSKQDIDDESKVQVRFGYPHYLQTFVSIIVWFNCMDLNNNYSFKSEELLICQDNCIANFEMFYNSLKNNNLNTNPFKFVLNRIHNTIHRFSLPTSFLIKIKKYF